VARLCELWFWSSFGVVFIVLSLTLWRHGNMKMKLYFSLVGSVDMMWSPWLSWLSWGHGKKGRCVEELLTWDCDGWLVTSAILLSLCTSLKVFNYDVGTRFITGLTKYREYEIIVNNKNTKSILGILSFAIKLDLIYLNFMVEPDLIAMVW
jgi:hypothetical protein